MMGKGHVISGAMAWLVGCAALEVTGHQVDLAVKTVGTAVCAGWALAPDLDHPSSTVARSLGPVTKLIATGVGRLGAAVHARTRTPYDRVDLDGHRTISHTVVWAALCGLLTVGAGRVVGPWAAAVLVFAASVLALRAALPLKLRKWWVRGPVTKRRRPVRVDLIAAVALAAVAYTLTPGDGWWLGLAVGTGCVVHCLGDALTESGCPMLWPVPIGRRGRRRNWYPVGTPRCLRFGVNGLAEKLVTWFFVLVSSCAVWVLVWT